MSLEKLYFGRLHFSPQGATVIMGSVLVQLSCSAYCWQHKQRQDAAVAFVPAPLRLSEK